MEKNEKISVVVPIYNVEEYLPRCLDSIIAQTYSNIEIMLVDDGSPDGAGAICDEYAARDERIRVFHIPNGGVAKARQLGVESSTGDYIVFVDPDDWLPLDSIEVLYSNMTDDVDIVIGGHRCIKKLKQTLARLVACKYNHDQYKKRLLSIQHIYPAPWGRIYRRRLFIRESFPVAKKAQDWLMNIEISVRVRAIAEIEAIVYNYFQRETSTLHNYKSSMAYEGLLIEKARNILIKQNELDKFYTEFARFALIRLYHVVVHNKSIITNEALSVEVYNAVRGCTLSLKERIARIALISPFCQWFIYYTHKIYLVLRG